MGKIIDEMVNGYGPKFPGLKAMFGKKPTEKDLAIMKSPVSGLGRYYKNVSFLEQITSGRSVGLKRFKVIIEYFIALNELFKNYKGDKRKVVANLTPDEIRIIRSIGLTEREIFQAEFLEGYSEHDTAAAGDYVKFRIAELLPHLEENIEGIHFGITSEDVMANVFGLIGNELVYDHFIPRLLDFCNFCIDYSFKFDAEEFLILPALTHRQAAEVTFHQKKWVVPLCAIQSLFSNLLTTSEYKAFSGKMTGATGNDVARYASYPDIDWVDFSEKFVSSFGLANERFTHQSVTYAREADIFSTIINILVQVVKMVEDFIDRASCPAQLFIKQKKEGVKGSSIMPGKSNAWKCEGAIEMLLKGINNLQFLVQRFPRYPHEGNMSRSFLMRDIGADFMPIFIALDRVQEEMLAYHPNQRKIRAFLEEYPGMSGSALQSMLKREGITGDAYRVIQGISINPDGSYANAEQFFQSLSRVMADLDLATEFKGELSVSISPGYLLKSMAKIVNSQLTFLARAFKEYDIGLGKMRARFREGLAGKIFEK